VSPASAARRCGLVGLDALDHRAAPEVRIADALQQINFQWAAGVRSQLRNK